MRKTLRSVATAVTPTIKGFNLCTVVSEEKSQCWFGSWSNHSEINKETRLHHRHDSSLTAPSCREDAAWQTEEKKKKKKKNQLEFLFFPVDMVLSVPSGNEEWVTPSHAPSNHVVPLTLDTLCSISTPLATLKTVKWAAPSHTFLIMLVSQFNGTFVFRLEGWEIMPFLHSVSYLYTV